MKKLLVTLTILAGSIAGFAGFAASASANANWRLPRGGQMW